MRVASVVLTVLTSLAASGCAAVYEVRLPEHQESPGVPDGHLPPPGSCRVWYDDRPAGQQPPPTSCGEAERTAARERGARVIYSQER